MALKLYRLAKNDEEKFNEFIRDWKTLPTIYMDFDALDTYDGDFDKFLVSLDELADKKNKYPEIYYFLMEETTIYGFAVIRPKLNEFTTNHGGNILYGVPPRFRNQGFGSVCLREAIVKAREHGIKDVLLTCHKLNVTAARVSMNNGAVQDSEGEITLENGDKVRKFWVKEK